MVPRATRKATPLTAVKPANSLVKSSVSRITSPLNATDVPSPRSCLAFTGVPVRIPRRDRDGNGTPSIAARRSQYDLGCAGAPIVAGGSGGELEVAQRGGPARRWGDCRAGGADRRGGWKGGRGRGGGPVGSMGGVEGGVRASTRSGGQ